MYRSLLRIKCKFETKAPRRNLERNSDFGKSGPNFYPSVSSYIESIATIFMYTNSLGLFRTCLSTSLTLFCSLIHFPHHSSCHQKLRTSLSAYHWQLSQLLPSSSPQLSQDASSSIFRQAVPTGSYYLGGIKDKQEGEGAHSIPHQSYNC